MRRIALLPLVLCAAACGFQPAEGGWSGTMTEDVTGNAAGAVGFELTRTGHDTFDLALDFGFTPAPVASCTLNDTSFSCAAATHEETSGNATLTLSYAVTGSFPDDATAHGQIAFEQTCQGTDCTGGDTTDDLWDYDVVNCDLSTCP
jgi:hypothetical protein